MPEQRPRAATPPRPRTNEAGGIRRAHLLAMLVAVLAIDGILLLPFLGAGMAAISAALLAGGAVAGLAVRLACADPVRIPAPRIVLCLATAVLLLILGGEGGWLYANVDWQVRDAVLRDMAGQPWPFAYRVAGAGEVLLRAPIGMYLLPALAGRWAGHAGLWLLVQNGLLVGLLLALGSTLFDTARARACAAVVVIGFSGMDALGALLLHPALLASLDSHLEFWSGLQFSSTVTLLFWVPQHGIAGWIGALLYLLWRRRAIPLSLFLGPLPLLALWSPFGLAGILPFAAIAGASALAGRSLRPADLPLPLCATLLAAPAIGYLLSGSGDVGALLALPDLRSYGCIESIETLPPLLCLALARRPRPERIELAVIAAVLLIVPLIWVGRNCDFMMRASIPALTVLAVRIAEHLLAARRGAGILIVLLLIGAATPLHEIARALGHRPPPPIRCSLIRAFDQSYADQGIAQYVAPIAAFPAALRPHAPAAVPADGPGPCWDGDWTTPR